MNRHKSPRGVGAAVRSAAVRALPAAAVLRATVLGLTVLAALLAVGCQSYVFEPVSPSVIVVSNRTYELADIRQADILFVVDDSGSMAGEQANLAANFDAFINRIEQKNQERVAEGKTPIDYRIAVTTTSVVGTFEPQPGADPITQTTYARSAADGCETSLAFNAGDPFPAGDFVAAPGNDTILDSNVLDSQEIIRQFRENVRVGICGTGHEMGLEAMKRALEKHPDFVREKSKLVVAFLSDEEDCSDPNADADPQGNFVARIFEGGQPVDNCVRASQAGTGLGRIEDYADFLRAQAPSVGVGVIVGANVSGDVVTPAACNDPACAASCDCGGNPACVADPNKKAPPCYCGGQSPGARYLEFATVVGGSLKDSICQDSFANTLEALADVVTSVDVILLDTAPQDPSLVLLKIIRDGEEILCQTPPDATWRCGDGGADWEYQDSPPAIRICPESDRCTIQPGDKYKVSFVELACTADAPCTP